MFIRSELKLATGNVTFDNNASLWFQFSYSESFNMHIFNFDFLNFLNFWGHDPKTSTTSFKVLFNSIDRHNITPPIFLSYTFSDLSILNLMTIL